MNAKQRGFTLIEILVVVTIIGVLAGLVVVLIPKSQAEAAKLECINNLRNIAGSLQTGSGKYASKYPPYAGPNLALYLVKKGELQEEESLGILFCPGDNDESLDEAGGLAAYKGLDLDKQGEYDDLTSYAGRNQKDKACRAKKGAAKQVILFCDDGDDHHPEGLCVAYTGGQARFRSKVDDWKLDHDTKVEIGEGSDIDELKCLIAE